MRICPARHDVEPGLDERGSENLRILDNTPGVELELGLQSLVQRDCLGCNHVHQRSALQRREHRRVDSFADLLVIGEDKPSPRPA